MKIAFFSPLNFSSILGATKHRIEMAVLFHKLGWETYLISPSDLGLPENYRNSKTARMDYSMALKNYLQVNADRYDVVLYEYDTLPYQRKLFSSTTLFIASPALLFYHFRKIKYPVSLKEKIKKILIDIKGGRQDKIKSEQICEFSMAQADVIQVQNEWDKKELLRHNFSKNKIIVVRNGISVERRQLFEKANRELVKGDCIAFVGTFDFRKGACDFPKIVAQIHARAPGYRFKLIGTKGLFTSEKEVKDFFPKRLRGLLEVYPIFAPEDLPLILSDCSLGIFPSYIESFGYGVLEMMTAGLPVVCYRTPGPSDFVPAELLIPQGDTTSFANKVLELIESKPKLYQLSKEVLAISERHCWDKIGIELSAQYSALLKDFYDIKTQANT